MKYSCLMFGEGRRDIKFIIKLSDLPKFKYHTSKWELSYDNASGKTPKIILNQCKKAMLNNNYDLVICFIDLDKLKESFQKTWQVEQKKLETIYKDITIIWQVDKLEDELKKIIGSQYNSKKLLNNIARQEVEKFINSAYWKRILSTINNREKELTKANKTELEDALNTVNLYKKEKKAGKLKKLNSVKELM